MNEEPISPQEELRALQDVITNAYDWSGVKRYTKAPQDSTSRVWALMDEIGNLRAKVPPPTVVEKDKKYAFRERGEGGPWTIGKCTAIVNEGIAAFQIYDQYTQNVYVVVRSTSELEIVQAND